MTNEEQDSLPFQCFLAIEVRSWDYNRPLLQLIYEVRKLDESCSVISAELAGKQITSPSHVTVVYKQNCLKVKRL